MQCCDNEWRRLSRIEGVEGLIACSKPITLRWNVEWQVKRSDDWQCLVLTAETYKRLNCIERLSGHELT